MLVDNVCTIQALFVTKPLYYVLRCWYLVAWSKWSGLPVYLPTPSDIHRPASRVCELGVTLVGCRRGHPPQYLIESARQSLTTSFLRRPRLLVVSRGRWLMWLAWRPGTPGQSARPGYWHRQLQMLSRLDYCNAVLAGIPWTLARRLQSAMNATAWLVFASVRSRRAVPTQITLAESSMANRLQAGSSGLQMSSWPGTVIPSWRASPFSRVGVSKASAFRFVS